MDKLIIKGLQVRGYHGCLDFEKRFGQWFEIDLEIFQKKFLSTELDKLQLVLDYTQVIEKVKNIVETTRFNLIESLAEYITDKLIEAFLEIKAVRILLKKPQAPIAVKHAYCGIEIYRER